MNANLISFIKFSQFKLSGKIGKNTPWQNVLATRYILAHTTISAYYIVYIDTGSMLHCTTAEPFLTDTPGQRTPTI